MGWKCDLLIADSPCPRPIETALGGLVGVPLERGRVLKLEAALVPEPPLGGCLRGNRTIAFLGAPVANLIRGEVPALEKRLIDTFAGSAVLALHLSSFDNSHGWASWTPTGARVRARFGNADALHLDEGEALRTERAALSSYTAQDREWFVDARGERWSHDQLGEEVVFALMNAAVGIRPDRDDLDQEIATFVLCGRRQQLLVENDIPVTNPSLAQVESALSCLRSIGPSFAILELESGSYVQAGGSARDGLLVEVRRVEGKKFTHWCAGLATSPSSPKRVVPMSAGEQRIPANEVLAFTDAVRIFAQFHADGTLASGYDWRDRTRDFTQPA